MNVKADLTLIFVLLLVLILVVYYVGTASLVLAGAHVGEQLVYFLTGRDSQGRFAGTPGQPGDNNALSFPFTNWWQQQH